MTLRQFSLFCLSFDVTPILSLCGFLLFAVKQSHQAFLKIEYRLSLSQLKAPQTQTFEAQLIFPISKPKSSFEFSAAQCFMRNISQSACKTSV